MQNNATCQPTSETSKANVFKHGLKATIYQIRVIRQFWTLNFKLINIVFGEKGAPWFYSFQNYFFHFTVLHSMQSFTKFHKNRIQLFITKITVKWQQPSVERNHAWLLKLICVAFVVKICKEKTVFENIFLFNAKNTDNHLKYIRGLAPKERLRW